MPPGYQVVGHFAYAVHSGARVAGSPRDRLRDVILYIVRGPHYFGILYPCSCGFMILADIWIFGHLQDIRATEPRRVTGYLSHEAWVAHLLMAIRIWGELV